MKTDKRTLFGTDGIRGVAGEFPLDRVTTRAIGRALGHQLARKHKSVKVVIGQDTRESSAWIADCVAAGLNEAGVEAQSAGVIPTPGVAFLARTRGFAAGVVISASHNPWTDNGIKVVGHDGYKLADAVELEIEREIYEQLERSGGKANNGNGVTHLQGTAELHQAYTHWLVDHWKPHHAGKLRAVVDCANGAASAFAGEVFRACGIDSVYLNDKPDGKNINQGSGALHPEVVAQAVREHSAQVGVTFDGDADRCLFSDSQGRVVNGDGVLLLAARQLKAEGKLAGDLVVATTMSNMGLEAALKRSGVRMLRAPVGDKYVLEEMTKSGATLGGEQSGHIIFRDGEATTGDGLLTALRVLQMVVETGQKLEELLADLKVFPQVIKNVRVREKRPLNQVPAVARAIEEAEKELDGTGRVVVRYSGTEALARVMVEAESEEKTSKFAESIAKAIQETLGA
jgi:phosphoglucosamine mutase